MMIFMHLAKTVGKASKWLVTGKILTIVGTGVLTVAPTLEMMKQKKKTKEERE